MGAARTDVMVWAKTGVAAMACVVATSVVATGVAQADAGHDHAGSAAKPASVTTTLGPVQRLGAGDWRALYGTAPSTRKLAQASYRARGCRIARSKAKYFVKGVRTFTAYFDSRFCWDKGRKKAVQRGYQDSRVDVAAKALPLFGLTVDNGTPLNAFSQRWHGGAKGLTHMNTRYAEKVCIVRLSWCTDVSVYLSIHGHYDGTAYDHQFSRKG